MFTYNKIRQSFSLPQYVAIYLHHHIHQPIHRADSLTLDPHKWLFQPYDVGCVLIRNSQYLSETFRMIPEYIKDT
ncbi:pyridoxal-dependent decarboxylase, partial [Bacillus sp. SS-TM]